MKKIILIGILILIVLVSGCKKETGESNLRELSTDSKAYLLTLEELDLNAEIINDIKKDIYSWPKKDRDDAIKNDFKEGYERLFSLSTSEKDPFGTIEPFGLGISISRYSLSGINEVFNDQKKQIDAQEGSIKNNLRLKSLPNPKIGDKSFAYLIIYESKKLSPEIEEDIRKNVYAESYIESLSEEEIEDLTKEKIYTIKFIKNNIWVEVTTMKYGYGLEDSIKYAKMIEDKIE